MLSYAVAGSQLQKPSPKRFGQKALRPHNTANNFGGSANSLDSVERTDERSEFVIRNQRMEPAREAVIALESVKANWDSYGSQPPSERAREVALQLLTPLKEAALFPERVLPSAEGGVTFIFTSANENRAVIEAMNDGEDFILLYDRQGNSKTLEWSGEISHDYLGKLKRHLRGLRLAAS